MKYTCYSLMIAKRSNETTLYTSEIMLCQHDDDALQNKIAKSDNDGLYFIPFEHEGASCIYAYSLNKNALGFFKMGLNIGYDFFFYFEDITDRVKTGDMML